MKTSLSIGMALALALALAAAPATADIMPIGTISAKPDGANFDYTIKLTNSAASTDVIGTFWYAWLPTPADFLATAPIDGSIVTPTDWKVLVTHFPNSTDNGYALQWVATTTAAALAPGDSLTFGFSSADTPAQVFGKSLFFDHPPVGTSVVYHAGPFSDAGVTFVVKSVPEPSSLALIGLGGLGLALAIGRKALRSRTAPEVAATP